MTDKEAYEAALKLKEFCTSKKFCKDCIFRKRNDLFKWMCRLNPVPTVWKLQYAKKKLKG